VTHQPLVRRPRNVQFAVNRVLVYGGLLAGLGLLMALALGGLSRLLPGEPVLIFALAAGLAGLLFQPLRRRLQALVDRHWYGIRLDYWPRPEPAAPVLVQNHLGPYKRLEPAALAGLGQIYRSHHPALARPVALKLVPPALAADAPLMDRLRADVERAARLQHPHLARPLEVGQVAGHHFVVMEHFTGQDLATYILINGRLALDQTLPLLSALAGALDAAHAAGLAHGALSTQTVLLALRPGQAEQPRPHSPARDMSGVARAALLPPSAFHLVVLGMGLGVLLAHARPASALAYLAPEQLRGQPAEGRTDQYALGVMAYLLLSGELPFPQQNPSALALAHLCQPPPDPRDRVPRLPPPVALALQRALAKDPARRFPTAGDFVLALQG
jgi:serine/threonine-protein kinase